MRHSLEVRNLSFKYRRDVVLEDVNFKLDSSGIVALLGANGSGKTTLLKLLLGILKANSGEVLLNGRSIADYKPARFARIVSYVAQAHHCAFPYTVYEIVMMGRENRMGCFGRANRKDRAAVDSALERLGVVSLKNRIYSELSGGERQLILIARALAQETEIIVMDEPVSGLDYGNQIRLLEETAKLADSGLMIIKSTHYPDHALMVADDVLMLHKGVIFAKGSPERVINPENMKKLYRTEVSLVEHGGRLCLYPGDLNRNRQAGLSAALTETAAV